MLVSVNWAPVVEYRLASANPWRLSIRRDTMLTDILYEDESVRTTSCLEYMHTYTLAKVDREPLRNGWNARHSSKNGVKA